MQPGCELLPTAAEGNPEIETGPPGPPHCTRPSNGFAVADGIRAPGVLVAVPFASSIAGAVAGSYLAGSKLNACFCFSRYVPSKLSLRPKFTVRRLVACQSSWK